MRSRCALAALVLSFASGLTPRTIAAQPRSVPDEPWFLIVDHETAARVRAMDRSCEHPRTPVGCDDDALERAVAHHRSAQTMLRGHRPLLSARELETAREEYTRAARAYREHLACDPDHPIVYEIHYNLADALYWSEQLEEAAVEFRAVRDWPGQRAYDLEAARRMAECYARLVASAEAAGTLRMPPLDPRAPRIEVPRSVARLILAWETYLSRAPAHHFERHFERDEPARAALEVALLLARHGFHQLARARLERARVEACRSPAAGTVERVLAPIREAAATLEHTALIARIDSSAPCAG